MTETPSKREQAREERRGQILEAALVVFSDKGYHATNVSDVAAKAGVSQGTIYWYFDSKDELFEAAILAVFEQFGADTMIGMLDHETATEKLRGLTSALVGFGEVAQNLFTLFLGYWASSPDRERAAKLWSDLLGEYKELIVGIVDEGIRNREFKPVDAEAFVWMLMAAYDGLAAYLTLMPDLDLVRISETFVETLLAGLALDEAAAALSNNEGT
jgi:AcrR family transcriptional regulator